ncbi:unnamed protein product [Linum trigynum]|uniref:Uncharacterized protein n=1 Tax=Linum trigynum TaxID=586398 RepID=A0AAV2FAZ5_9ROSI
MEWKSRNTTPASWKVMTEAPSAQPQAFSPMKQQLSVVMMKNGRGGFRPVITSLDQIQSNVEESIKGAEEACAEDLASGECLAV